MSEITNNISGGVKGNPIFGDGNGNTMTYQENQAAALPEPDQIKLKDSLTQLQKALEADPKLSQEQKQKISTKLNILEDAVENPKEKQKQEQAKNVAFSLKDVIDVLSPAATFLEAFNKLWPLITKVFGL